MYVSTEKKGEKKSTHQNFFYQPAGKQELPVLEYQLQQWRLLPLLAGAYAIDRFSRTLFEWYVEVQANLMSGDKSDRQAELGKEIHAISSSSKPYASWFARDTIQTCREACGGHGYLAVNRLGTLREYALLFYYYFRGLTCHLVTMTLIARTRATTRSCRSRRAISFWTFSSVLRMLFTFFFVPQSELFFAEVLKGSKIESPLGTFDFLGNFSEIIKSKSQAQTAKDFMNPVHYLAAFDWIVCYRLAEAAQYYKAQLRSGKDEFTARNDSQVYNLRDVAMAYIERLIIFNFVDHIKNNGYDASEIAVLQKLCDLFAVWSLEKQTSILFEGGYIGSVSQSKAIKEAARTLCTLLKDEAIALADIIAPSDHVLHAPIGQSNGEAYKNLYNSMTTTPKALERASFWQDFVEKPVPGSKRSVWAKSSL